MSNFWDILWTSFLIFAWIAYLMVLFTILGDLFRDRALNGWYKALWIIFLVVAPFLAAFIYLIARGSGMADRSLARAAEQRTATDAYIRQTASTGPAADIAQAKNLLDSGAISQAEFDSLKEKALA